MSKLKVFTDNKTKLVLISAYAPYKRYDATYKGQALFNCRWLGDKLAFGQSVQNPTIWFSDFYGHDEN